MNKLQREHISLSAAKQRVLIEERHVREIGKGLRAAEEGRLIDHKDIKGKWEAKREAQ